MGWVYVCQTSTKETIDIAGQIGWLVWLFRVCLVVLWTGGGLVVLFEGLDKVPRYFPGTNNDRGADLSTFRSIWEKILGILRFDAMYGRVRT